MRPTGVAAAVSAISMLLTACGGSDPPAGQPAVTTTPTVTASGQEPSGSASTTAPSGPPKSAVQGRAYDLGVVVSTATVGDVQVATLDRWTVRKLGDAKLARNGYRVRRLAKSPFYNQNSITTYVVPLTDDVNILYHHCLSADEPLQTRSATVEEMAGLDKKEQVVLVTLDEHGYATAIENYPVC